PALPRPPAAPPPLGPMPVPSRPRPMAAPPTMSLPSHAPPASMPYPSAAPARSGGGRSVLAVIAGLLVIGLIAALAVLLIPRKGTLVATAAGPGNKALDSVQVLIDGSKKCESSPCRVANVDAGTHM